jgi:hypothetical protein
VAGRGDAVVARFTVPTQEAQALPPGAYCVRLSRAGQVSETFGLFAAQHRSYTFQTSLLDRQLWETPVEHPQTDFRLMNLAGRLDVIEMTPGRLLRLNGTTGQPVWSVEQIAQEGLEAPKEVNYLDPQADQPGPRLLLGPGPATRASPDSGWAGAR